MVLLFGFQGVSRVLESCYVVASVVKVVAREFLCGY